jgi:DNA-binding response OmpR family regulator
MTGTRKRLKALILDDEPSLERLFILMMEMLDWDCEVVTSREKALVQLKRAHFDVLITDYHLKQGNGLHLICCLRQEGITLPAIVMSDDARALRLIQQDLLNIPALLLRPFTASELQAVLGKISRT